MTAGKHCQSYDNRIAGMPLRDGVFLEDLCPKLRVRRWRQSLHELTDHCCVYCGQRSESIDHMHPRSRGGPSVTENCVPACLPCNGRKGDTDVFIWYRSQSFYDPRRAMALRAWSEGDMKVALRLLEWVRPTTQPSPSAHQTRQASTPAWRWQMAS
jgi:hypothetical protein